MGNSKNGRVFLKKVFSLLCAAAITLLNIGCSASVDEEKYISITDEKAYKEMSWNYTLESDVIYGQAAGKDGMEDLKLDIYKTEKEGLNPAIILLHGGGLTSGDKANASIIKSMAIDYAKMGYVVVVPNYRLSTAISATALNNAMSDAKSAYEWLLANGANYGVNTKFIAVGGYSAGADIAINMCYSNHFTDLELENICCVIDICGGNLYYAMTDKTVPGCVIVHGTMDTTVKYSNSEAFSKLLTAKNVDVSLNPLQGLNHDVSSRYEDLRNTIAEYMYKCFTGKETTISIKAEISPEYQKVLDRVSNGISYDVMQVDVKVDGLLDEWKDIDVINLDKIKDVGTSLPDEKDFSGNVMLAWNKSKPTTLYIAATIKDDDIKDTVAADGKWYQDDCLEIVIDSSENELVQQLAKWVIGAGDNDLSVFANTENTTVVMTDNGDEYIYEISIDISKVPSASYQGAVQLDFSQERSIGFSICYNDAENGERQHQIGWTAGKSSDRTMLGTLCFK